MTGRERTASRQICPGTFHYRINSLRAILKTLPVRGGRVRTQQDRDGQALWLVLDMESQLLGRRSGSLYISIRVCFAPRPTAKSMRIGSHFSRHVGDWFLRLPPAGLWVLNEWLPVSVADLRSWRSRSPRLVMCAFLHQSRMHFCGPPDSKRSGSFYTRNRFSGAALTQSGGGRLAASASSFRADGGCRGNLLLNFQTSRWLSPEADHREAAG
jgi:hypothetical protein